MMLRAINTTNFDVIFKHLAFTIKFLSILEQFLTKIAYPLVFSIAKTETIHTFITYLANHAK